MPETGTTGLHELSPLDERLGAALADGEPDIGTLWEFCAFFEWEDRRTTVDGICGWLGSPRGLRILDCACGSGFPAIELAQRGYDITCSDGSTTMLRHFRRNVARAGLAIESDHVRWEHLAGRHRSAFDVVMCRGASFPYAGTWDRDAEPDRAALTASMEQFATVLRPGGRLYVDTTHADDLARVGPQINRFPSLVVAGHAVEVVEVITNQPHLGIRVWHTFLTVDGITHEFQRRSHYLRPNELVDLLTAAGLVDVRAEEIPGEHYQVYSAVRQNTCD